MLTRYRLGVGFSLIGAGVVVAILGYLGVSKETEVAFQLPYFASAGVGALLLFGAGASLLLSLQMERDDTRIADLELAVRQLGEEVGRIADALEEPRSVRARTVPMRRRKSAG